MTCSVFLRVGLFQGVVSPWVLLGVLLLYGASLNAAPSSGTKPLYLDGLAAAPILTRSAPGANSTTAMIGGNGGSMTVSLSPATVAPLILGSGNISIPLWIGRNFSNADPRTVTVTLSYSGGSTGILGSDTQTFTIAASGTVNSELITFNINLGAPVTLNAATTISLTITNDSALNNRRVEVSALLNGIHSAVDLNADTVINVDSVGFYDAPYPGGALITTVAGGGTAYVRAVVSDPFGSFDITSAIVEMINPLATPVVSGAPMTEILNSGAATKTYEYAYAFPALGSNGIWTAQVTAAEGSEGTVSHTETATITVIEPPVLTIVKSASGTTANPGSVITYTIQVSSTGGGDAINVVLDDAVSAYTVFGLDSFGSGVAFQFADGSPASGVSLATPVYSNDGGATFNYIPVSGGGGAPQGFDGNVTNWRMPLSGTFSKGSGFSLRYKMQLE